MKIHFIGIGGIGVSALARYYLLTGHKISGSDLTASGITKALQIMGAKVYIGKHQTKSLSEDVSLLVYSPAVTKDNLEIKKAEKLKIQVMSYPEALGKLTKEHFTIAVAGSHGKSTVCAMLSLLLVKAGLDPTVIMGTKLKEFGDSNCRIGKPVSISPTDKEKRKYLVIEADEHFASFLNYRPQIVVLTALEPDHLDYYKTFNNLLKTFRTFISLLPQGGILVTSKDSPNIKKLLKTEGTNQDFLKIVKNAKLFYLKSKDVIKLKKILKVPGEFNIFNALSALTVARALNIPDKTSFKSLSKFKCSWRRFETNKTIINKKRITIIDDYGHHPTQVKVALKAAREKFPKKKIWCVYQPHQYQRTHYLFKEFIKAFKGAPVDRIIITDIYSVAGREDLKIKKMVNSQKLVKVTNKSSVNYLPREKLKKYLKRNLQDNQILIIMGAGDIYDLSLDFRSRNKKNVRRKKVSKEKRRL